MFMMGEMVEEESCVCPRFARATLACLECDIFFSCAWGSRDMSLEPFCERHFAAMSHPDCWTLFLLSFIEKSLTEIG